MAFNLFGAVAALYFTVVALGGVPAGFESVGHGSGHCSEGSDREKSSKADVHLLRGRAGELSCSRGDGVLFC